MLNKKRKSKRGPSSPNVRRARDECPSAEPDIQPELRRNERLLRKARQSRSTDLEERQSHPGKRTPTLNYQE